jgi:transcriptional regulator with XRE-family HTH domain
MMAVSVMSILKMINKEKFKQNITDIDIAKALKVTKGAVSQYFSGKARISFFSFLKLIDVIYRDDFEKQKQLINSFCNATSRPENLRLAMEYFSSNSELDLLGFLVKKEEDSHNKTNKEWSSIYELLYLRQRGSIDPANFRSEILERETKINSLEMKILTDIAKMYMHYDLKEYHALLDLTGSLLEKIKLIKNTYIRESFKLRAIEGIVISNIMNDNITEARMNAEEIENLEEWALHSPRLTASILHWIGQTYVLENPNKAVNLVEQGLDILRSKKIFNIESRINSLQDSIDFIKILSGIDLNIKPRSLAELAHLLAKQGKNVEAANILYNMKLENKELTEFQLYYLFICNGEKSLLHNAIEGLKRKGNMFYANIIKNVALSVKN